VLANFLLGMLRTRARDLADYPEPLRRYELVVDVFCRGAGANGSARGARGTDRKAPAG
jgi:hypothetical protein